MTKTPAGPVRWAIWAPLIITVFEPTTFNNTVTLLLSKYGGKLIKVSIPTNKDGFEWGLEIAAQMISNKNTVMANDIRSRELLALAKKVALTNVTVFINGPTGTGKEVISNYIHNNSKRSEYPFVANDLVISA